jgi:Mce-associated membrane protein
VSGRGLNRWFAGLAALFFACAAGLLVVAGALRGDLDRERAAERDRRAARRAAAAFGQQLFTYDYRHLDAYRDRVLALTAGKARSDFRAAFGGLRELIAAGQTRVTGTVTDVFLGDVDDAGVTAIVVVDARATGKAGPRRLTNYVQLDLVKVGATWRVGGVTNLNITQGGGPPAPTPEPSG